MRLLPLCVLALASAAQAAPHNVLLFVADGLRDGMVSWDNTPAMASLFERGVRFANPHSVFPTFTTANASALATGHYLGDTGDFSNVIYAGFPAHTPDGTTTVPFLENDDILGEMDTHFGGDYLDEETILRAAADRGFSTAAIGKGGPTLIQDHASSRKTLVVDDFTGHPGSVPLDPALLDRLGKIPLAAQAPTRGENGHAGDFRTAGTNVPNRDQQAWFTAVATRAILPLFKERGKPFAMVYWSRDPDGTQHNQGDSLGTVKPGINGPTSLAAIRNADDNLATLLATLKSLGLDAETDVLVVSDHGFSTIAKESTTSFAASQHYDDVPAKHLPPGFLAIDLAHALGLTLFDPDAGNAPVAPNAHSRRGNGVIAENPAKPAAIVAMNGGSDLIYVPGNDKAVAKKIVMALSAEDYTSGIFVADGLGPIDGTMPFSLINLEGSAVTPHPAIVVSFRSFSTGCAEPTTCTAEIADTPLQQGQGMHGSFSRADTRNVMGAAGPDFRAGYEDPAPASNADIGQTMAAILGLAVPSHGALTGRVLTEAFPGAPPVHSTRTEQSSIRDANGHATALRAWEVGTFRYLDAAGYPGRTVGLDEVSQ